MQRAATVLMAFVIGGFAGYTAPAWWPFGVSARDAERRLMDHRANEENADPIATACHERSNPGAHDDFACEVTEAIGPSDGYEEYLVRFRDGKWEFERLRD